MLYMNPIPFKEMGWNDMDTLIQPPAYSFLNISEKSRRSLAGAHSILSPISLLNLFHLFMLITNQTRYVSFLVWKTIVYGAHY